MTNKNLALFTALLFSLDATASFTPLSIKGQADASKATVTNLQVSNNQATLVAPSTYLLQTGNNNILSNPSFEHSTVASGWTLSVGTPASESSVKIHGEKSLKVTLSAQALTLYQDSTRYQAQFADGVQGSASIRIKTSVSGIYVCARLAGTTQVATDGSRITNCLQVSSENKWLTYKLPIVLGGTSNGIAIVSLNATTGASANITGDVYFDDAYLGTDSGVTDVSGIGPWNTWTPTGTWVTNVTYYGRWRLVGDSIEVEGTILVSGAPTATSLDVNLPPGFTMNSNKLSLLVSAVGPSIGWTQLMDDSTSANNTVGVVAPSSTSSTVRIRGNVGSVTATSPFTWAANDSIRFHFVVPVNEASATSQMFATNCGALCVDEFTAEIAANGTVSNESPVGFINGNCTNADPRVCTYDSGIIANAMVCTGGNEFVTASVAASFSVDNNAQATKVTCRKTGTDLQVSRQIIGTFRGMVSNSNGGKPTIESCRVSHSGVPTADTSSGLCSNWLGTLNDTATGQTTMNFTSNFWSSQPVCLVSIESTNRQSPVALVSGTSSVFIRTFNSAGADTDMSFSVMCMGFRN
jgi:hypothetical protein